MTNSNTLYILNKMGKSTNINIKEIKDYLKSLIEKNHDINIFQDNDTLHESNIDKSDLIHIEVCSKIYDQVILDLEKIKDNTSSLRIFVLKEELSEKSTGTIQKEIKPNF